MKRVSFVVIFFLIFLSAPGYAVFFEELEKGLGLFSSETPDENAIISGLKEALSIGTENAVESVSQVDGYFGNEMVKILMPEKMHKVADILGKVGYQQQVDDFILSMNRGAEKAAPKAASIFVDAIKEMTFEDAKSILDGGDTAATDYFKAKTSDKTYEIFNPIISASMNEVGVTRSYKELMDKYTSLPFMEAEQFDLDHYVTKKAQDGLFYMLGQEEKKIRTDPTARVTKLLQKVFGE